MNSELIEKARALMQAISAERQSPAAPAVVDQPRAVSARTLLADHDQADVEKIMAVWRRLFGFSEPYAHIEANLRDLRRWQTKGRR